MSRSKRKKKTRLCYCGERITEGFGNRNAHDMCDRLKPARKLKEKLAKKEQNDY